MLYHTFTISCSFPPTLHRLVLSLSPYLSVLCHISTFFIELFLCLQPTQWFSLCPNLDAYTQYFIWDKFFAGFATATASLLLLLPPSHLMSRLYFSRKKLLTSHIAFNFMLNAFYVLSNSF